MKTNKFVKSNCISQPLFNDLKPSNHLARKLGSLTRECIVTWTFEGTCRTRTWHGEVWCDKHHRIQVHVKSRQKNLIHAWNPRNGNISTRAMLSAMTAVLQTGLKMTMTIF